MAKKKRKKGSKRKDRKLQRQQKRGFPGQDNRMVDSGRQSRNKGGS